jgi:hypothetical protein
MHEVYLELQPVLHRLGNIAMSWSSEGMAVKWLTLFGTYSDHPGPIKVKSTAAPQPSEKNEDEVPVEVVGPIDRHFQPK